MEEIIQGETRPSRERQEKVVEMMTESEKEAESQGEKEDSQ